MGRLRVKSGHERRICLLKSTGNKMTFIGLKKQEDRDAVQVYMKDKTTP